MGLNNPTHQEQHPFRATLPRAEESVPNDGTDRSREAYWKSSPALLKISETEPN